MKRILIVILLSISLNPVFGQGKPDTTLMNKFLLDFSVPDMPAFKALGTDPSNILRPSDVSKFAAMITPFYSSGQTVIPKNFALEFAPWKYASKNWKLSDYVDKAGKRLGYRSSFSLGTTTDTSKFPSKVSIGYRMSILSEKADIYRMVTKRNIEKAKSFDTLDLYRTEIRNWWVIEILKVHPELAADYIKNHTAEFNKFLDGLEEYIKSNTTAKDKEELCKKYILLKRELGDFSSLISDYKSKYWNAGRTDIALAWVGQSKNDQLTSTQFASLSLWVTQAIRISNYGQILVGGNFTLPRSTSSDSVKYNWNVNTRFYVGNSDFRGFIEGQYKFKKFDPNGKTLLINLGAEFRVASNFWVIASTGLNNYLKETHPFNKLVSNIDLRYSFNKPK